VFLILAASSFFMGTSMESLPTTDKFVKLLLGGVELVIQPNGFPKEIHVFKWRKEI
jgi:hypothetical protein